MGVPLFFKWLCERIPHIIIPLTADSMVNVDNLYIDFTGIIHRCNKENSTEQEIVNNIFDYLDFLISIVTPKK